MNGEEEVSILTSVLKLRIVELIKDLNGNHVVQRCLQKLNAQYTGFIYDAACDQCYDIAQHRHGCCVLQRCIDYATADQKIRLVACIAKHGLQLSNNAFGNYVIQVRPLPTVMLLSKPNQTFLVYFDLVHVYFLLTVTPLIIEFRRCCMIEV